MKRLSEFRTAFCVLLFPLALVLAACATQTSGNLSTWQEQYDLGMRYLTESNYEEAIMAFTAAIEIDPKQADPYVYLTQAYLAAGDMKQAETVRSQGYEATGDVRLSQSIGDGWIVYDDSIPFEQRLTYRDFGLLSDNQQETLRQLSAAVQADDRGSARSLLLNGGLPAQLCTVVDGYKTVIYILGSGAYRAWMEEYYQLLEEANPTHDVSPQMLIGVEIRPEHGIAYNYYYAEGVTTDEQTVVSNIEGIRTGECSGWQYNGPWNNSQDQWGGSFTMHLEWSGTAADNVLSSMAELQSLITIRTSSGNGIENITEYQNGWMTACYTIESSGEITDMLPYIPEKDRKMQMTISQFKADRF